MSLVRFGRPDDGMDRRRYGFHPFGVAKYNFDRHLDRPLAPSPEN